MTKKPEQQRLDLPDDPVQFVWDHYEIVFPGNHRAGLSPSRRKLIERGLREGFDAHDLCIAIDGLKSWRRQRPGDETLSAIFATRPGGAAFADQIEFFISQAETKGPSNMDISRMVRRLQRRHEELARGEDDARTKDEAEAAEAWLREHGIEIRHSAEGRPYVPINDMP